MRIHHALQIYQEMTTLAETLGAINLAQGIPEPRYDARWRAALAAELPGSHFQYTPSDGIPALRDAVGTLHGVDAGLVLLTAGCTEAMGSALLALAEQGRGTVVWLEPFYSYYPGLARLAGLTCRSVPIDLTGPAPRLDTGLLRSVLAPLGERAVLLLNIPHNPTGLALDTDGWAAIAAIAAETGCFLLLDDVYRSFGYGASAPPYGPLLASGRAAIAGALSKSHAATGLRIGWLLAPDGLRDQAETAHMHMSNCTPDLLQRAAVRVIAETTAAELADTAAAYRDRRDLLLAALGAAGLRTVTPDGGHFVMAEPAGGGTALDGALRLAHKTGVVPLPLETFFTSADRPWLRFSFAVAGDRLAEACDRLARGVR
ncbi:pyridoxal phosphate-dependent aminotransferase [Actinocorallia lasiicapitis]